MIKDWSGNFIPDYLMGTKGNYIYPSKKRKMEFPGGPVLGLHTSTGGGTKSIPDQPTKILQTILCNQKEKKKEEVEAELVQREGVM